MSFTGDSTPGMSFAAGLACSVPAGACGAGVSLAAGGVVWGAAFFSDLPGWQPSSTASVRTTKQHTDHCTKCR